MPSALGLSWGVWRLSAWVILPSAFSAFLYLRGYARLRARSPHRWTPGKLAAQLGCQCAIVLALCSPIEWWSDYSLQAHMLQHLMLTMVAAPLWWLSDPYLPMLFGWSVIVRREVFGPFLRDPFVLGAWSALTRPVVCWFLFVLTLFAWHIPSMYDLALRSSSWHRVEHACLFVTALLFWHPVMSGLARPHRSGWHLVMYLLLADVINTVFSALFAFSDRVLYETYRDGPRWSSITALEDQARAGVLMWVPGSLVYLVPMVAIASRLIFGAVRSKRRPRPWVPSPPQTWVAAPSGPDGALGTIDRHAASAGRRPGTTSANRRRFDLLRTPILGRWLASWWSRQTLRVALLVGALLIVLDGFWGPPLAATNLAGVVPWIDWRGMVALGLLTAGNVVCHACPLTLPRDLVRRVRAPTRAWPAALRNKYPAAALLVVFFACYEVFSWWNAPRWTAALVVAYLITPTIVDSIFSGASFCKFVCPIGQFQFVHSAMSPWTVGVREKQVCSSCSSHDCLVGNSASPGCQLELFLPAKRGNLDCTGCLDCVRACPTGNVGVFASWPAEELLRDERGAGIGRRSERLDLAVLTWALVSAAFANAALMTAPVLDTIDAWSTAAWNPLSRQQTTAAVTIAVLIALPSAFILATALASRALGEGGSIKEAITRWAQSFIPLGFSLWAAHYLFHFATGAQMTWPIGQRFISEFTGLSLGEPAWEECACRQPPTGPLLRVELLLLQAGLLGSLYLGWNRERRQRPRLSARKTLRAAIPWLLLMVALYILGVTIIFSPMEMRGMPGAE